jgi:hypothetical protein
MTAEMHYLRADHGATFRLSVRYLDSDRKPVDLSVPGYASTFSLSRSGGTVLDTQAAVLDADGWIKVTITDEDTATWPIGKYHYCLDLTHPSGEKDFLLAGPITIREVC